MRSTIALALALGAAGCASAPIAAPPQIPAAPSYEQKLSWILRLEDQRVLRDPSPPAAAPTPPVLGQAAPVAALPPSDLLRLLTDGEARVRRRAALAVGRIGLAEGVEPLVPLLRDAEPEVRQMSAFALGLIGDRRATEPLLSALGDPAPVVKGSAAEALGLLGDAAAATPIAQMAAAIADSGALATVPADELDAARDTPAAAFRLALYALVKLKSYDGVATAALDAGGLPRVKWWPVAFSLQRLEDPRALQALLVLAGDPHPYTRGFAVKGLGAMRDRAAEVPLLPLVSSPERAIAVEAIRSLGRLRAASAAPALIKLLETPRADPLLRLEAASVMGGIGGEGAADALIDLLGDPSPGLRAAAIRSLAQLDGEGFITILSGLDEDRHWSVRAALATVLGTLTADAGLPRLRRMLDDPDGRVVPAVLASIAKLKPDDAARLLLARLEQADPIVRSAAAQAIAVLKPAGAQGALISAYAVGLADTTYLARASVLTALAAYGAASATPTLTTALGDKDWAVRVRAAALLKELDPASDADQRIGPVPIADPTIYSESGLRTPPYSTEAFIDTDRGTIHLELAMLDAPQTVRNFVDLARRGFFDGLLIHRVVPDFVVQIGDPRGDGEGGPGYTIRDELNQRPYLRGTVGMALDWADTGGSQFFITHSPQPHLDARYTVFGRVLSGMEVVDQIEQWDAVRRVRIWDGTTTN